MTKPLKKGDKVVMHTCGEASYHNGQIWTVRSDESVIGSTQVVWLEGYDGAFATEFLQRVNI